MFGHFGKGECGEIAIEDERDLFGICNSKMGYDVSVIWLLCDLLFLCECKRSVLKQNRAVYEVQQAKRAKEVKQAEKGKFTKKGNAELCFHPVFFPKNKKQEKVCLAGCRKNSMKFVHDAHKNSAAL